MDTSDGLLPQTSEEKTVGQQTAQIQSQKAWAKLGGSSDEADDSDADRWWWCTWTAATTFNKSNQTKWASCALGDRQSVPQQSP